MDHPAPPGGRILLLGAAIILAALSIPVTWGMMDLAGSARDIIADSGSGSGRQLHTLLTTLQVEANGASVKVLGIPGWIACLSAVAALVMLILNTMHVTSVPRSVPVVMLSFSSAFAITAVTRMLDSDIGSGGFLLLAGSATGLFLTFRK